MGIDPKTLRDGDIVRVRGRFICGDIIFHGGDILSGRGPSWEIPAGYADIQSVEPRPIEVGDTVKTAALRHHGKVIAIDGDLAWVKVPGCRYTLRLADLRHVHADTGAR